MYLLRSGPSPSTMDKIVRDPMIKRLDAIAVCRLEAHHGLPLNVSLGLFLSLAGELQPWPNPKHPSVSF